MRIADRENVPTSVYYDPVIDMRSELLDRVMGWAMAGIDRYGSDNFERTDGGFHFDGIDYYLAMWPGDGGKVEILVSLRPPPWQ